MERELNDGGIETYLPSETVVRERPDGSRFKCRRPVISSLMFFKSTSEDALHVRKQLNDRAIVYSRPDDAERRPAPIPDKEMNMFMLVTSSGDDGLEYFQADDAKFCCGQRVRVTDGRFKGAEGFIKRIRGNRRLVVTVHGLCAVATSYIPGCFLEKI